MLQLKLVNDLQILGTESLWISLIWLSHLEGALHKSVSLCALVGHPRWGMTIANQLHKIRAWCLFEKNLKEVSFHPLKNLLCYHPLQHLQILHEEYQTHTAELSGTSSQFLRKQKEIQSREISIRHFQKRCTKIFTPVVHTVNRKTWCRVHVWSIKVGKIRKTRNKQTNIWARARKKKLHSSRRKRNKSCLCFDTLLIQSFNIKFKVRSL